MNLLLNHLELFATTQRMVSGEPQPTSGERSRLNKKMRRQQEDGGQPTEQQEWRDFDAEC